MLKNLELPLFGAESQPISFASDLISFRQFGAQTLVTETLSSDGATTVPTYINEFWTAAQRDADNLHEVSYRACFKPQLPRFFIERLTRPGDVVYDPFMGRGTTLLEALLLSRIPFGNDINPLSRILIKPRLNPPALDEIIARIAEIDFTKTVPLREDLLVFYHPETLQEICALREYLLTRAADGKLDALDEWIRMVAINRLTGHSAGFFSVYTLPPNQAVSIKSQQKINQNRNQTPPRRSVPALIIRKSRALLKDLGSSLPDSRGSLLVNAHAAETHAIPESSVDLVVTSPPFLDVVDYAGDNWLRCWFAGIDPAAVKLTTPRRIEDWQSEMMRVF